MLRLFVVGIFIFTGYKVEGRTFDHTFTSQVNFDDPNRWQNARGGIPCAGDKVQFTSDQVISIYVQSNSTITEMILPMTGDFIIGDGVIWGVSSELSGCSGDGRIATFNSDPDNWFDPGNWQTSEAGSSVVLTSRDLLDTERVPCDYDTAVFLQGQTWTTDIPLDVDLGRLNVRGQNLDQDAFADYRASGQGFYQFQGDGKVTPNGETCTDVTGCVCRDRSSNTQDVESFICQKTECSAASCEQAISQARGQCCDACGALLRMDFTAQYTEAAMTAFLASKKLKYDGTHTAFSKVKSRTNSDEFSQEYLLASPFYIQVLVTDESQGTSSGSAAKKLAQEIFDSLQSPSNTVGVRNVTLTTSGGGVAPGMGSGAVAGIVIGVLLAVVLATGGCIVLMRNGTFHKYSPHKLLMDKWTGDNPMFDVSYDLSTMDSPEIKTSLPEAGQQGGSETSLPSVLRSDFGVSFQNPVYLEEDV